MWFPDNTPMLRSFKSRPLGSRLREARGSTRACRPWSSSRLCAEKLLKSLPDSPFKYLLTGSRKKQ